MTPADRAAVDACAMVLRLECPLRIMASLHQGQRRHYRGERHVLCLPMEGEVPEGWERTESQKEMDRLLHPDEHQRQDREDV